MDRAKIRFTSGRALAPQNKKRVLFCFRICAGAEGECDPDFLDQVSGSGASRSRLDPAI